MVIPLKGCFRYVSQEYSKLWLFKSYFCDILIFGDENMKKIKKRIFEIIQVAQDGDKASRIFDLFILALILVNVLLVILDTFSLPAKVKSVFGVIETISVVIFTVEYILRIWTSDLLYPDLSPARARIQYIFSFMALIDLFAILPFYIPFLIPVDLRVLRMLRMVRLLRIFKVNRYTHALSKIGNVFRKKANELLSSIFIVCLLMLIASVIMYNVENAAQPDKFNNALSGLWWAIATLTTVGYGDIYPVTAVGKVLSAIIAVLGIGLVAVPTGIISAGFMEQIESPKEEPGEKVKEEDKHYCPYCGHKLD